MKGKIRCRGRSLWQVKAIEEGSSWVDVPNEFKFLLDKNIHHQKPCEFHFDESRLVLDTVGGTPIAGSQKFEEAKAELDADKEAKKREKEQAKLLERSEVHQRKRQENREYNFLDAYLPKDTRNLLIAGFSDLAIDNFALKLKKTANFPEEGKPAFIYRKDRKKGELRYSSDFEWLKNARLDEKIWAYAKNKYPQNRIWKKIFATASRMIIGIGDASVYEVGITLHHIYGIPYIPASALKGLTRSWMIISRFGGDEGNALSEKSFCDMFGCPAEWKDEDKKTHASWYKTHPQCDKDSGERQGNILFFDAFPTKPPKIEEDIMNVHYPDYYRGERPPTDFQSPNPIAFLTVAKDTPFQFILGVKEERNESDQNYSTLLDQVTELLVEALTHHGIGAKTAVGYGYFEAKD